VRLRDAPHGAKRIGKHRLEVTWAAGKRLFEDEAPYQEGDLDGVRWAYCGYDPKLRLHLIFKACRPAFTGALLDDVTGALLPGGQDVLFTTDQQDYVAYEMADGDTTEILKVYRRNGEILWTGHNGFTSADNGSVVVAFHNLHWNSQNRLGTLAVPADGAKPFTITLTPNRSGKWNWERKRPAASPGP